MKHGICGCEDAGKDVKTIVRGKSEKQTPRSFIKVTVHMLVLQLVLLLGMLLGFLYVTYQTGLESRAQMLEHMIRIYGNQLQNKIENYDRTLERIVYDNYDYIGLQSEVEAKRYYSSMNLLKRLNQTIVNDRSIGLIVIAEAQYETYLQAKQNAIDFADERMIREFVLRFAKQNYAKASWSARRFADKVYIYKMFNWQGRVAAVFVPVTDFMGELENFDSEPISILLRDASGVVHGYIGKASQADIEGRAMRGTDDDPRSWNRYNLAKGDFSIEILGNEGFLLTQIRSNMVMFLLTILLTLFVATYLIRYIRKKVLQPMQRMEVGMREIQNGDYHLRMEEAGNLEFSMLTDTFNRLMDEILGLKMKSYEKQILLQETELKAIRLQIRPHFFLNAMTTISGLSMQKKYEEIKAYIETLSKHIRYLFKSGLHTVCLSEEIRHVKNYFEMQELKYPNCVFYCIEAEPDLNAWRIPQMLIHTIIENEYKYAISMDEMLTILIKCSKITKNREELLLIEIEDDGKGYPMEVLEQFSKVDMEQSRDGSRIGLWSIKRMLEIMYERTDLFEIGNVIPHGCINRILIPREPVLEWMDFNLSNKME